MLIFEIYVNGKYKKTLNAVSQREAVCLYADTNRLLISDKIEAVHQPRNHS